MTAAPLRLRRDPQALVANWRSLARLSGRAACGAAIKADGYGLGAAWVATTLAAAGCRDFFVATWAEAAALAPLKLPGLSVLHGVRGEDMATALTGIATPVLNTAAQAARWKAAGGGTCDVMLDTGMNRLGLGAGDLTAGALDGLNIDTLMSHLASADDDSPKNSDQRGRFVAMAEGVTAQRLSLANSAGIALGADYAFDLTRPGLALYGGVPRPELADTIRQVAFPQAQVLQRRHVSAGETVGYNATWTAPADTDVAILNIGYADGYWRGFSGRGQALHEREALPVLGRVSMDLTAVDVTGRQVAEGDWLDIDYDLPRASAASGMSQYELLTGLGDRFERLP
ncbi:alanine racemase [Sphingomonas panacisoli]|uniref:alanine racemase n=1 Tax=Sphingomonas panacisoli TaxID=1813879 RepID=A0A5B8LDV3_9SPHN|nr:alanine racemase [Sphingomonas panacisoli]QDZ06358.1 alanine racemase [Sphingomonas panacisoli]